MSKKNEPGMAYDTKVLNKVFAFLSIIFFFVVIWVFLDDFIRPWKFVQVEAQQIKRQKINEKLDKAREEIKKEKLEALKVNLAKSKKIVAGRKREISSVESKITKVNVKIKGETITNGQLNSKVSALTFNYGVAHAEHRPDAHQLFDKLQVNKKLFAESKNRLKGYQTQFKAFAKEKESLMIEKKNAEKEIKNYLGKKKLLKMARSKTDINPIFALRNGPLLDYLDPTLKIQQIVLTNITDDRYFQHVPKVDRCITCHTFIDQKGYEDQANPHKTHPNLDLMLGEKSPHPMKEIGCTVCHGGEGHRVNDFSSAAHIPDGEEQMKDWVKKYHYHPPHKVPQPMLKKKYTESSCIKCHKDVEYIPGATNLNKGRRDMEKFGCYGCHKIEGWEHKRKPGPSLEKIASKVSKEFFKNWAWDPKSFNPYAKMPRYFEQDNNSKEEFVIKNIAEVNAMAEYIWEKSKDYKPFAKYNGGNSAKGKELIKTVGCMGCHGVEGYETESYKVDAYSGPYLKGTGSKVDPDWLVSWLKKPDHYQEDTIMPSLRLSDKEANNIAAYLLSLKNKKFDKLKFAEMDKGARDEILISYFSAFDTVEVAKAKLEKMSDRERTIELGQRSIGKYGCYSCHNIEGFEGRAPIGPELTNVGTKPITQFGFGHEHDVEHSRDGWIKAHLLNPRRWDNGADKPFKDLTRMPNFYMSEEQAEGITLALLGQVSDYIPKTGIKNYNAHEGIVNEGMKVIDKFNCQGCHKIDGMGGDITAMYADDLNEGPPFLNGEGHRVQTDWLYHFLDNVYPIRPWLQIRMPSYKMTSDEKNKIIAMFQHKAEQKTFVDLKNSVKWKPGERAAAVKLFKALDCATCHTSGFNNEEAQAPNLYLSKRRLRPSWIKKWLKNPQAILEYTTMPNFWEDGEAQEPDILGGDPVKQIDALTKYIYEIGSDNLTNKSTKYWSKQ